MGASSSKGPLKSTRIGPSISTGPITSTQIGPSSVTGPLTSTQIESSSTSRYAPTQIKNLSAIDPIASTQNYQPMSDNRDDILPSFDPPELSQISWCDGDRPKIILNDTLVDSSLPPTMPMNVSVNMQTELPKINTPVTPIAGRSYITANEHLRALAEQEGAQTPSSHLAGLMTAKLTTETPHHRKRKLQSPDGENLAKKECVSPIRTNIQSSPVRKFNFIDKERMKSLSPLTKKENARASSTASDSTPVKRASSCCLVTSQSPDMFNSPEDLIDPLPLQNEVMSTAGEF